MDNFRYRTEIGCYLIELAVWNVERDDDLWHLVVLKMNWYFVLVEVMILEVR